jgi:hypothetical protein
MIEIKNTLELSSSLALVLLVLFRGLKHVPSFLLKRLYPTAALATGITGITGAP